MKKLIIAAAIAAGALVSQAASFVWGSTGKAYSIDSTTVTAGLEAGQTYGVGSNNAASMSNQISSYGAVWTYVMTLTDGSTTDTLSGTLASGDFASRYISKSLSSAIWDGATADDPVTIDYSIVYTGTLTDDKGNKWTITSNEVTGSKQYSGVGDITLQSAGPSSWTTPGSSIPEPTSGLLMLLGVAGLALRRKVK